MITCLGWGLLTAGVLTFGLAVPAAAQAPPTPPEELPEVGAAYRTGKSMFFGLRKVEVVGTTPSVSLALAPDTAAGGRRIIATIDATTFDSGTDDRDTWVAETLAGADETPLIFTSRPVTLAELRAAVSGQGLEIGGELELPEGPREVLFTLSGYDLPSREGSGTERFIEAWSRTTFDALGIEVPRVGPGGVIASPGDDLELWLRVPAAEMVELLPGG